MSEVLESPPKVNLKCKEPRLYQVSAISVSCGYGVDVGPKLCADLSSIFSIPGRAVEENIVYLVKTGRSVPFGTFTKEIAIEKAAQANGAISKRFNMPGVTFFIE
jgi:hypothetical protein